MQDYFRFYLLGTFVSVGGRGGCWIYYYFAGPRVVYWLFFLCLVLLFIYFLQLNVQKGLGDSGRVSLGLWYTGG